MPRWSNPDAGDDDQDKVNSEQEPKITHDPLLSTFMWWLVVLPLGIATAVVLAIRYHLFP